METQDLKPARAHQKRKRALSATSNDDSNEYDNDGETVKKTLKRRSHPHRSTSREDKKEDDEEFLMSGAIPNNEVIYEPVEDDDDFIRSNAPSPSSVRSIDEDPRPEIQLTAPKKKGLIFSPFNRRRAASEVHSMLGSNFGRA